MTDVVLSRCLAEQILELSDQLSTLMNRDGLPNSLGHFQKIMPKIEQRAKALIAISKGEKPELPI